MPEDVKPSLWTRLKSHHVYRVVIIYVVTAWILVQVANNVFPSFGLGAGAVRILILALVLGFPVTLAFAWAFIRPKDPTRLDRWERLHWKLGLSVSVVVLALVVISGWSVWRYSSWWQFSAAQTSASAATTKTATSARPAPFQPPPDTLAVLPFKNLGGGADQQYFSDGITEELTNVLGQDTPLHVIAWDTASKYRDSKLTAVDIGKALNVAYLLNGSIRRSGNEVRVTSELVDTTTGYQTWSQHYDGSLKNIFAVQDRISSAIASALKVKFATSARATETVDPKAYELVLKARAQMQTAHSAAPFTQAQKYFEEAIALDPDYADAHAGLARATFDLTQLSTLSLKQALPRVRAEARKALALDPENVTALVVLGNADLVEGKVTAARSHYEQALKSDPSNATAHLDYSLVLPPGEALAQTVQAVRLDPDNATAQNNLAIAYLDLGNYAKALAPARAVMRLAPHSTDAAFLLALTYSLLHRGKDAAKAFDLAQPTTKLGRQLIAAGRLAYRSAFDRKLHSQALAATNALWSRPGLDPASQVNLLQTYLVLGEKDTVLGALPKTCAASPIECSDLSLNPVYLPLHGDPRFEALVKRYDTTRAADAATATH